MIRTTTGCATPPRSPALRVPPRAAAAAHRLTSLGRAPPALTKVLSVDEIGTLGGADGEEGQAESLGWETHPPHVTMHAEL